MRFDFFFGRLQLLVMHNRLATALIAMMLIVVVGGHWFCIQSVAWVGMFAKFSQTCTFTEALVKTFNGKNPCTLCIAVQQGKKSEQRQESVKVETKVDFFLSDRNVIWVRPGFGTFELIPHFSDLAAERFERPPTPPPRPA
jgi:hypothetical protein